MNKIACFLCGILCGFILNVAAQTPDFSKAFITGQTNKSPLSYRCNDEMIFTFTAELPGIDANGYFMDYRRQGDDGQTFTGRVPADRVLTVKTSLDRPGFVSIDIYVTDQNGKHVTYQAGGYSHEVNFLAGAAVQPETLTDCGEPADFDAFWLRQKERLEHVEWQENTNVKKVNTVNGCDIYAVTIPCAGPRPATGYMSIPVNAAPASLPIRIVFAGYGDVIVGPQAGSQNEIAMFLNAHGQALGQSAEHYKEFFRSICSNGHTYAFDPKQNSDPEEAFFNGMALRIIRTLQYLKSRQEWNGRDVIACGDSQGGLQTIWAAALDNDVTEAYPGIIWCCDLAGNAKKQRLTGPWRIQYTPALDYYDPVFMAKRIKNAKVEITRAGMGDYICPPSGLAVCYNNLATPRKSVKWVQGSNHNFVPKKSDVIWWRNEVLTP